MVLGSVSPTNLDLANISGMIDLYFDSFDLFFICLDPTFADLPNSRMGLRLGQVRLHPFCCNISFAIGVVEGLNLDLS